MIDASGNITLNKAADFIFYLDRKDELGAVVDISTANLTFIVKGNRLTLVPELDPSNPKGRMIHFTEDHAAMFATPAQFILREALSGGIHNVLWSGTISTAGFAV